MLIKQIATDYEPLSIEWQRHINEWFTTNVNDIQQLKELRDYVESTAYGFGERSFYYLWKLIVDQMPQSFTFLEIGVYRGQTLALVQLLAKMSGKQCRCIGVTPLNETGGFHTSDYAKDIKDLHTKYNLRQPAIIKGYSTAEYIIDDVKYFAPYNIVYIDGGHDYEVVKSDLNNYANLASNYLVIDDCCNNLPMPDGYFRGIESVTKAVIEWEATQTNFKLQFNLVHNKLYKTL